MDTAPQGPTEQEIEQAASILAKITPGYLPKPLFLQVTRLVVTTTVEVVPFRKGAGGDIEVLLTRRDPDDPYWPNMLHTPGAVVRASDAEGTYQDALERVLEGELHGIHTIGAPVFVEHLLHRVARGMESAIVHYVEVADNPTEGTFYPVERLPEDLVGTQAGFIRKAAAAFAQTGQEGDKTLEHARQ